ncbi:uncharacterized protein LOC109524538 [Hippocampus comes]|uniref:uncharacterized protein LOC109524538 n=1 Tax=Hippocampus comes TaxID=109280 RepID=UPI00094EF72E|nr:PREDICTED: uncharacterized protein LOC109524538 [Hippocampus comes]
MCARTTAEYLEQLSETKMEKKRQRRLLDAGFEKLRVVLNREGVSEYYLHPERQQPEPHGREEPDSPDIKLEEEPEALNFKAEEEPEPPSLKAEEEPEPLSMKAENEPKPCHIKEEEQQYEVAMLLLPVVILKRADVGQGESGENTKAKPPSSSSSEHMTAEGDGDPSGQSQAHCIQAPPPDGEDVTSHSSDTGDEHSRDEMKHHTDNKLWKCSQGPPQSHGPVTTLDEPKSSRGISDSVFVRAYQKRSQKRAYSKRHYCLYCSKPYAKMARHLESAHQDKSDVATALSFPKGSKERKKQLDYIRNRGNFAYNTSVLESGKGELVPFKQPPKEAQGSDFMHCTYCQGLFSRKVLWRHMQTCGFKPGSIPSKPGKNRVQSLCTYRGPMPSHMSKELWGVISAMNRDPITDIIQNDKVIIDIGQCLLNSGGTCTKNLELVRGKLRQMGRLVSRARMSTSLKKFEDFIDPQRYTETAEVVKVMCRYDGKAGKGINPTLANKLGDDLVEASKLLTAEGLITGNQALVKKATEFQEVHREKWNQIIGTMAPRNIRESRWKVPTVLSFTEDVQKLHTHLNQMQDHFCKSLAQRPSAEGWVELSKVCLSQVTLFNRRREGAVAKMPLAAFLARDPVGPHEDVDWALSIVESKLCRHFTRVIFMGKYGRPVPILLTLKMLRALQLLVWLREQCGVLKDNQYLFARPGVLTHVQGSNCLRGHVKLCGAKFPTSLTSARMRQHAATLSTVLNLTNNEMLQLPNVLGHDITVPPEFSRVPETTMQLAKISKVLMALEQGRLAEFQGQNLGQIGIYPHEKVFDSSDDDGETVAVEACSTAGGTVTAARGASSTPIDAKALQRRNTRWSHQEVQAVKKHMSRFITSCIVPAKYDCDKCLRAEPEALKNRSWQSVKFYVYNRIQAKKKKTLCE